jgi:hypothetical protein
MLVHKLPSLTIAILLMAIQAALVIPGHAQSGATRDPDVLGRLMQGFADGVAMDAARWMVLQTCLQNERHARQLQVGPFRYYQPHATRPGQSTLPVAVERSVLESAAMLMLAGRCFRAFRVTTVGAGSSILTQRLHVGDRIFAIDGYIFRGSEDFFEYISTQPVGSEAVIAILTAESDRLAIIAAPYEDVDRIRRLNPPRR